MAKPRQQRRQFGPSCALPREITWRLGQNLPEHCRQNERETPADQEERSPPIRRQHQRAGEACERTAERDADNRQRDREWPAAQRHVLRGERRRVRHGSAKAESGEESQRRQRGDIAGKRREHREHAERNDAPEQRAAATDAVAEVAARESPEHHAEQRGREHRCERRPWQRPLAHHRRHRRAEQLVVEPVKDDRQRRARDEQLLMEAPASFVQYRGDIDGGISHAADSIEKM